MSIYVQILDMGFETVPRPVYVQMVDMGFETVPRSVYVEIVDMGLASQRVFASIDAGNRCRGGLV